MDLHNLPNGTHLFDDDSGQCGTIVARVNNRYIWEAHDGSVTLNVGINYPGLQEMAEKGKVCGQ